MDKLIATLIGLVMVLLGISKCKTDKIKKQKKEIDHHKTTAEKRDTELRKIKDVQTEIEKIKQEVPPEKISPAPSGDSDTRIDRLNRLHKH